MDEKTDDSAGKCPVVHGATADAATATGGRSSSISACCIDTPSADPMSKGFDYAKEFKSLDLMP